MKRKPIKPDPYMLTLSQVTRIFNAIGYPTTINGIDIREWAETAKPQDPNSIICEDTWDGRWQQGADDADAYWIELDTEDDPYECWQHLWLECECVLNHKGRRRFVLVAWEDRYWGGDWIGGTSTGAVRTVREARAALKGGWQSDFTAYDQWIIDNGRDPVGRYLGTKPNKHDSPLEARARAMLAKVEQAEAMDDADATPIDGYPYTKGQP